MPSLMFMVAGADARRLLVFTECNLEKRVLL